MARKIRLRYFGKFSGCSYKNGIWRSEMSVSSGLHCIRVPRVETLKRASSADQGLGKFCQGYVPVCLRPPDGLSRVTLGQNWTSVPCHTQSGRCSKRLDATGGSSAHLGHIFGPIFAQFRHLSHATAPLNRDKNSSTQSQVTHPLIEMVGYS